MSDSGHEKQTGGLARSIDALFAERAPKRAESEPSDEGEAPRRPAEALADEPGDSGEPPSAVAEERAEVRAPAVATEEVVTEASLESDGDPAAPTEEVEPTASTEVEPTVSAEVEPTVSGAAEPTVSGQPAPQPVAKAPTSSPDTADRDEARALEVAELLAEVDRVAPAPQSDFGPEHAPGMPVDLARRVVAALGHDRDDTRRERLTSACQRLGEVAAIELSAALTDTGDRAARRAYLDALVAMGRIAMPVVERMMDDERWYVLRNGVAILGEIGGERATGHIVGALARPEPKVRREALLALAKIGGSDAGQLAYGMLEDPDLGVRLAAVRAVGDLTVERAHKRLVQMLQAEDDPDLLVAVLRALGRLGDPGAVNAIERHAVGSFLRSPPTDVRIAAYRALRQIGTPRARRLLNQAVDDRDPVVKQAVRELLGMS